jgi:hypothetical protein
MPPDCDPAPSSLDDFRVIHVQRRDGCSSDWSSSDNRVASIGSGADETTARCCRSLGLGPSLVQLWTRCRSRIHCALICNRCRSSSGNALHEVFASGSISLVAWRHGVSAS